LFPAELAKRNSRNINKTALANPIQKYVICLNSTRIKACPIAKKFRTNAYERIKIIVTKGFNISAEMGTRKYRIKAIGT
jgi:hypothetical protein